MPFLRNMEACLAPARAGSGVAVGRNGVCVLEHGASYFAPLLVHPAKLTDWTHVAVVYREGQPSLYLNGVVGSHGTQESIHRASDDRIGGGGSFVGEIGAIEMVPRALEKRLTCRL